MGDGDVDTGGSLPSEGGAPSIQKAKERLFEGVLAGLPVILFALDENGRFLESVGAGLKRLGLRDREVVGLNALDAFPEARSELERALAGETVVFETAGATPDGDRWCYVTYATFDEHRGSGLVAFSIDVTERKRAEEELRGREEELRTLITNSPDSILRIDREGRIRFINRVGPGNDREAIEGASVIDLTLPEHRDSIREALHRVFNEGLPQTLESRAVPEVGHGADYEIRINPLRQDDEIREAIWVGRDISERKRAEERERRIQAQLQEAQKLESLGLLAGGIAHDFNNLLMGILGNASLAQLEMASDATVSFCVSQIVEATERAAELCQQLLAYSGRGCFVIKAVDLSELVLGTTRLLEVSVPKNVNLVYRCTAHLTAVEADVTQLRQVVMNLVVNAAEAIGDEAGTIRIETGTIDCDAGYLGKLFFDEDLEPGKYVYMEVSDTGSGMDSETRSHLFDPFFTTKETGRGLGMAAVLGIVRGHRGAVKVYSEPGQGTTVKILLPATDRTVETTAEESKLSRASGSGMVLVIDDDAAVLDVAERILRHFGYAVRCARSGEEGLALFREHVGRIRLVLLDMTMPGLTGVEVFQELRQIDVNVPVILSSGYNEQDTTSRFAGKGLAGFIQKPYTAQRLEALLAKTLVPSVPDED